MTVEVCAGYRYFNRLKEHVGGIEELPPTDPLYAKGFRFKDDQDRTYKADGGFNIRPISSKYDLTSRCR